MVEPITIGIGVTAAVGSAVVTAIITYFATKPGNIDESKVDSKGEIYNNVHLAVQENNNQNNTLVLLVGILVLMKLFEIIIYVFNTLRRGLKKKYQRVPHVIPAPQILPGPVTPPNATRN